MVWDDQGINLTILLADIHNLISAWCGGGVVFVFCGGGDAGRVPVAGPGVSAWRGGCVWWRWCGGFGSVSVERQHV